MICHILLDVSIYGGFSQISLPDAIRFVWKTSCTLRKVDRGWQIYFEYLAVPYRLFSFSGGTFLRGVQGNPNNFPILVQGDAVHGISPN